MKGETERIGRHTGRPVDKMGERGGGVAGGSQGRVPVTREEMQNTSPNGKFANSRGSGTHIPRNVETDTLPQSQERQLDGQRKECMENRRKVSEGVSMETGHEGPIAVTPTVKEVLHGMVDKDPSLFVPKFKKKTPTPTWKKSVVQNKDTLHDVPIFSISGSKRGSEDIMVETGDWLNGGKRVCNASMQGRLDRALATSAWLDWFPNFTVTHCPGSVSDHLALVVITKAKPAVQSRQIWVKRFEEKWATHPACEEIIRSSWNQQAAVGSPMFQLCHKLSRCRKALVDWSRGIFGAINLQIDHKLAVLEALHEDNHGGQHNLHIRAVQDEEVFDQATAAQIQQLPLSNPTGNDSVFWKATSSGIFTVKSAYQLAILTKHASVSGSSSTMKQYRKFWKVFVAVGVDC
ncbi:reverse mRNAase [Fagus crenata]